MLTVGLTGGVGAGKTTVAELFSKRGVEIIDADMIAREIVAPGEPCLLHIVERFGQDILQENGQLNRAKLQSIVFSNAEARDWLEALLHPLIIHQLEQRRQKVESPYCMLSVPLLIETGRQDLVHRILVVDMDEEIQIERVMRREHKTRDQVKAIINTQASRQDRLSFADDVIHNNDTEEALEPQVEELHQRYLRMSLKY